jgi:phage tail tube protein FII
MLTDMHKTQRKALALTFLEQYHEDGNEYLNHIVQVTGDETWISFVNAETKEKSAVKALDAHTFTKQAKNFK